MWENVKKAKQREAILLNTLSKSGRLNIKEVVSLLAISEATARRMFREMEKEKKIIRRFGGIQQPQSSFTEYSYNEVEQKMYDEKQRIGQYAASLIENCDLLYISGGTTIFHMTTSLVKRIKAGEIRDIIVTTNSVANAEAMADCCTVMLLGGQFRSKRRDVAGYMSEKFLKNLQFEKCFLGVDGLSLLNGLMAMDTDTARLDELAISHSTSTYVLATSDKFAMRSFVSYAPLKRVSTIISDTSLSNETREQILSAGSNIICV